MAGRSRGRRTGNFGHLLRLLEAERSWAAGDLDAAALAFDAARGEVSGRQRPWHRALITERAARFALTRGLPQTGFELLAQARQEYLAWGATAKVAQLDWAYPALRPHADAPGESGANQARDLRRQGSMLSAGTIDLLAIVSAIAGTELGNEHRRAAFPGRRRARRDDRRHRGTAGAVGRRPPSLVAARTSGQYEPLRRRRQPPRRTDVGAPIRPTVNRTTGRARRHQ